MRKYLCAILVLLMLPATGSHALGFTCNGKIVNTGDHKFDVVMKCGDPIWVENIEEETIRKTDTDKWEKIEVDKELWLYNFGPDRFMRELTFENDKLIEIKDLGYGYDETKQPAYRGQDIKLSIGISKVETMVHWGKPSMISNRKEERLVKIRTGHYEKLLVNISEWTYNFGTNRFIKILTFENGKLTEIKTGGYGY